MFARIPIKHEQPARTTLRFPDTSIPYASRLDRDDGICVFDYGDEGVIMSYLLFAGEIYYPEGGAEDLVGKFDSIEEAISAFDPNKYNTGSGIWANILCLSTLEIVMAYRSHIKWYKPD